METSGRRGRRAPDGDASGVPADLAARLRETAARVPGRPAVRWQAREITYAELDRRVDAAASALARLGVERDERVAVLLGNTPAFLEAFLGTLRAGGTIVPLNPFLTAVEVREVLEDCAPRVLVAAEAAWSTVESLVPDLGLIGVDHVVTAGSSGPLTGADHVWRDLLDSSDGAGDEPDRRPDDIAALVYTSGTTGRPKGAMLTRANLAANQDQVLATRLGVTEEDVILGVLPMFHIYAMNVALGTAVRVGATIVLVERFDPLRTLEDVAEHRVTVLLGAPPMYLAWLNTPGASELDLSSVRIAVSGAAPLPAGVLERFREDFGITIWEGYGLTEAAPAVTSNAMAGEVRPGAVGLPLPDVELRLVDDAGHDVRPGDPGEVWVRGPNVFAGYWRDEEATREALTDDGWLRTGDVGVRDEDGFLRLVDRKRDLVIVSGFNVYPREVERALMDHPEVDAAAVVGEPHPYTGEAVKAFVVPRTGVDLSEDEVVAWARGRLARYKCPEVVRIVDQLPYTATGKVRRTVLRDRSDEEARRA